MANKPRKQPNEDVLEGKEFLTYDEAMDYLGVRRSTLYTLITELGIETHKFNFDKKRYVAIADVRRLKEVKEKPWLAGEKSKEGDAA